MGLGLLGDGRTYGLPEGWDPITDGTREVALRQALTALDPETALPRLTRYYDPAREFVGTTFLDTRPNEPLSVEAADLWAVTRLNVTVSQRLGRLILDDGPQRTTVLSQLAKVPPDVDITEVDAALLERMFVLKEMLRTLSTTDTRSSSQWMFAAKLAARKRPRLFPVRDILVCGYLSGWKQLGQGAGRLGWFSQDLQAWPYLMTHPEVRTRLAGIRTLNAERHGPRLDAVDLRLLDVALYMAARAQGSQPVS